MSWRKVTDRAKRSDLLLRVADRLGRSRGRLRLLDRLESVPRVPHAPDLSHWNDLDFAATWIGHAFWTMQGMERFHNLNAFLEHAGLVGGFLLVAAYAWRDAAADETALHDPASPLTRPPTAPGSA